MMRSWAFGALGIFSLLSIGCQSSPHVAQAAEAAREQLQKAGVRSIELTPTVEEADQFLFQVEGTRGEKKVAGAAEVRYHADTPGVRLNLFEVEETRGEEQSALR